MTTITVQKNQNLSSLVSQYNKTHSKKISVAEVAKRNNIKDPDKIFTGQKIKLDAFDAPRRTAPSKPKPSKPKPQAETKPVNTTPVAPRNETPTAPVKQVREKGWLEWLVTYKPFG